MQAVLPPLFIQVVLTFVLSVLLAGSRVAESLADRNIAAGVKAGRSDVYSPRTLRIGDSFRNQFEVPVLFYAGVLLAMVTGPIGDHFVNLAWVFAVSRILHAAIHCSVNIILLRFFTFIIGVIAIALMWWELFQKTLAG